jgi:hypothetical protein
MIPFILGFAEGRGSFRAAMMANACHKMKKSAAAMFAGDSLKAYDIRGSD